MYRFKLLTFEPLGPTTHDKEPMSKDILTLEDDCSVLKELLSQLRSDGAETIHMSARRADGSELGEYAIIYGSAYGGQKSD